LPFYAGQYVSIKVAEDGTRRSYSICSSPSIDHGFELLVDVSPQGPGSRFLQKLEIGEDIEMLAPLGRFTLHGSEEWSSLTFIATGSGIAPFRGMIQHLLQDEQDERPIQLLWGMRYPQHLFWQDEFEELVDYFENFSFHPVMSQAGEGWTLCRGRVTDCLQTHDWDPTGGYFLCGSTAMIEDTVAVLQSQGVPAEKIRYEQFY
jgi:NAD(P)H-flavin reductase